MITLIIILHLTVCVGLILIVLLQTGKGASMGAAFGGSTQTVFGSTGSAGFLEKLTTAVAVIFMITCLSLTYVSARKGGDSVMRSPAAKAKKSAPASPAQTQPQKAPSSPTPAAKPSSSGAQGTK